MHKIPVGVLGASGYAGRELCGLIARHPDLTLAWAAAHEQRGERIRLPGLASMAFVAAADAPLGDAVVVFSALPHGTSAAWVARAHAAGAKVVDLSSDLRPGHATAPGCGSVAADAYGLPELERDTVRTASIVANPGCYATAVLLGLLPALTNGLVAEDATVSVAAASGVTGAGNSPRRDLMFAEVAEDFRPYSVGNHHRHLPEMRAVMGRFAATADLVFTPHLLPVARGIIATITLPLAKPIADPRSLWRAHYAGECFVTVADEPPALRDVVHRNVARLFVMPLAGVRRPTLLIVSALDNLLKGAAGQAVQNANLLLGLDESTGLAA